MPSSGTHEIIRDQPSSGSFEVIRERRAMARRAAHESLVAHLVGELWLGREIEEILADEVVDHWVRRSWRRLDAALKDPRVVAARRL